MKRENDKINNSDIMEGMSSISSVIKAMENGISNRRITAIYVDKNKIKSKEKEISFLKRKSAEHGFSVEFADEAIIAEASNGNSHGGIIAYCTPRDIPLLSINSIKSSGVYYMLEGIEDPYNFGYAIRSIYASGGDGIILSPRNWMGVAGVVARSSAGTSELIDMYVAEPQEAIEIFKKTGYTVICAGIRNSESIFDTDLKKPLLVVLGGEKRGISSKILNLCDKVVRIDYGTQFNGSLSTAAATAVFAFEILKANR